MAKKQNIPTWDDTQEIQAPSWDETVDVKKKESGDEVSEPSEEPFSLDTSVDLTKYQEPKTEEEPVSGELSFREQEADPVPDFMGLFKDKEKFKVANESGVSVSFLDKVNDSAKQAERPLSFLADVSDITKRLEALPEHFPETGNAAQALKSQLADVDSRNIEHIKEQVDALESNFRYIRPTQFTQGAGDPRWIEYENKVKKDAATVAIKRLEEDSKELVEVADIPKGKEVKGIFNKLYTMEKARAKGFGRGIEGYIQGYTEFKDQILQNRAVSDLMGKLDQIENGEDVELTEDDRLLLRAFVSNTELHEQLDSEIPRAYKIGEAAGHSLGFMGEFALTGGGKVVGSAVLKGAAKVGAKKAVGKFGVGMAVKLAQAGVHSTKMPMFYQNTALNVSRGMDFGTSVLHSYWETTGETFSERIFLGNPVGKRGIGTINSLMQRMGINFRTDKGAVGVLLNVLEETAEEKINEIFNAPKDHEDFKSFWKSFTDKEQNLIMIGSVGMTVGTMGAVAITGNAALETKHRSRVKKLEKFIPSDLRAEIDEILQAKDLSVKDQYSMIGQAISDRIERQELGEDPATTTGNAMLYADYHAKQIASEAANEDAKKEDGEIKTVGEVDPVGEMQEQLDYLIERGVEVPDGATAEDVQGLYEAETAKETVEPTAEEKLADIESGNVVTFSYESESEIPAQLIDRVTSVSETDGKKEYRVTMSKKEADFLMDQQRVETLEENIVKPKIKEDAKQEVQEREGAQQGVQKPEDEVTERSEETAEASKKADEEAVGRTEIPIIKSRNFLLYEGKKLFESEAIEELLSETDDFAYAGSLPELKRALTDELSYLDGNKVALEQAHMLLKAIDDGGVVVEKSTFREIRGETEKKITEDFKRGEFGKIVDVADESLAGAEKDALDQWIGATREKANTGFGVGIMNEKPMERLIGQKPDAFSSAMKPVKDFLKNKYGDVLTLYRVEDVNFNKRDTRNVLSYSSDPIVAEKFWGENKVLVKEQVPVDRIVLVSDRFGQMEFVVRIESQQPTTAPQKPSDRVSPEKGVTTPQKEKVAETAPTQAEAAKVEPATQKRIDEIDAELGDVWSDLADIVGAKKNLTGEQRQRLAPTVAKLLTLYAEKFALKGKQLVDAVVNHLRSKGVDVDQELTKTIERDAGQVEAVESEPVGGVREGDRAEAAPKTKEKPKAKLKDKESRTQEMKFNETFGKKGGVYRQIADAHAQYYERTTNKEQVDRAVDWLSDRTEEQIQGVLGKKYPRSTSPDRQMRRQVYIAYLGMRHKEAVNRGDEATAVAVYEKMVAVKTALSEEYNRASTTLQTAAHWLSMDNETVMWTVRHEIKEHNKAQLPDTDIDDIQQNSEDVMRMSMDIGTEAANDERVQKKIDEVSDKYSGKIKTKTNREKASELAKKIRGLKSSNWGITLAAEPVSAIGLSVMDGALEVAARSVYVYGEIADAVQKGLGHIHKSDWYKGLTDAQKRKINRAFSYNFKKDLGVEKLSKEDLSKYLKEDVKDLKTSLTKIVKDHWKSENQIGAKLSERIVADLGLSEADAKGVESTVLEIVKEQLQAKLTTYLNKESVPKKQDRKEGFIDKMGQLILMGGLTKDNFRKHFADTFGLREDLTSSEAAVIMNLHNAVVGTQGMGVFADLAADVFAKELDKLIPQSTIDRLGGAMVGAGYANVLYGYQTHKVNLVSVLTNFLLNPVIELADFRQWITAFQLGGQYKSISSFYAASPLAYMGDGYKRFFQAYKLALVDVVDMMKNGDMRLLSKYISEVQRPSNLRVQELERQIFGTHRFSGLKIRGKTIIPAKFNVYNYLKYGTRALAAEDAGMFKGFESVEMARLLRKKLSKEGLSHKEINDQINRQVFGYKLTVAEKKEIEDQLQAEDKMANDLGITTDRWKRGRRRFEIIRERHLDLAEDTFMDITESAKSNVFMDNRGGIVNALIGSISSFANKSIWHKLGTMPYFMFFKVLGNIGDFAVDTIPMYGSLRYRGYTPTTMRANYEALRDDGVKPGRAFIKSIFGKRKPVDELPFRGAQTGDKGSSRWQAQRKRAMIGNLMTLPAVGLVAGLWAWNDDEDDPWFDISGARWDIPDVGQREWTADEMPPWTIKIGGRKFRYHTKPALVFALSGLGIYRDHIRAGKSDDTWKERAKLMAISYSGALMSLTDLQIAGGFKDVADAIDKFSTVSTAIRKEKDPTQEIVKFQQWLNRGGTFLARQQISPFFHWTPGKNNMFQQITQAVKEDRKESRTVKSLVYYQLGIHHWTNKDAIDYFGKSTYSQPGYTQNWYPHPVKKRDPERWKLHEFLSQHDAVPAPFYNRQEFRVLSEPNKDGDTYVSELPPASAYYDLREKTGHRFYDRILNYYNHKEVWEKDVDRKQPDFSPYRTEMDRKVADYWNTAKRQARHYLYTWNDLKSYNKNVYEFLFEHDLLPDVDRTMEIPKLDGSGEVYLDENSDMVVDYTEDISYEIMGDIHAKAFRMYVDSFDNMSDEDMSDVSKNQLELYARGLWREFLNNEKNKYAIQLAETRR